MKNKIIIILFLLFSLKSFALQLTDAQLTDIYQGKFNAYFDYSYVSPIKYGCDKLIKEVSAKMGDAILNAMPFITGWFENNKKKIAIDVPFILYLEQKEKKHEKNYITLKFSFKYSIIYNYKKFINQKDVEKNKGIVSRLIEKLIELNQLNRCSDTQKYSDYLNDLRTKQNDGKKIGNLALLVDYDNECSKEELYNPDNAGIRTLIEEERLAPLKRIEYASKK